MMRTSVTSKSRDLGMVRLSEAGEMQMTARRRGRRTGRSRIREWQLVCIWVVVACYMATDFETCTPSSSGPRTRFGKLHLCDPQEA